MRTVLRMFWSTIGVGVAGLATLGIAIAVASFRYRRCGASSLDAADTACRLGAQLLSGAYLLLSLALVLGAASLTLLWRARRKQRRP